MKTTKYVVTIRYAAHPVQAGHSYLYRLFYLPPTEARVKLKHVLFQQEARYLGSSIYSKSGYYSRAGEASFTFYSQEQAQRFFAYFDTEIKKKTLNAVISELYDMKTQTLYT